MVLGLVFLSLLRFPLVGIIPPLLHAYLHLRVAFTRRTNGLKLESLKMQCFFRNGGAFDVKVLVVFISLSRIK